METAMNLHEGVPCRIAYNNKMFLTPKYPIIGDEF